MTCPNCGKEISETATLCTSCGWKSKKWEVCKQDGKNQHNNLVFAAVAIAILVAIFIVSVILIV